MATIEEGGIIEDEGKRMIRREYWSEEGIVMFMKNLDKIEKEIEEGEGVDEFFKRVKGATAKKTMEEWKRNPGKMELWNAKCRESTRLTLKREKNT